MTSPLGVSALSDDVLVRTFDRGSLTRGRTYAAEGRVSLMQTAPGLLRSVVRGSGRNTYLVEVEWLLRGTRVVVGDECSCPLGGRCKHVVATIVTARGRGSMRGGPGPANAAWRHALRDLLDDEDDEGAVAVRLALQFAVARPRGGAYAAPARPALTVRPLRQGRRDQWVRTGASWRDLSYASYANRDVDAQHVAVLRALLASSQHSSYYPDASPLSLSGFGPELWPHLRRAAEVGIAFVDGQARPGSVVVSDDPAVVSVDLRAAPDGALTVRSGLRLGGEPLDLDPDRDGVLGTPAYGCFVDRGADGILLVPFAEPLHTGLSRLLDAPPLTVPVADVDEFLDRYQPSLARRAVVASSDGSVTLTTSRFEGITLVVRRLALDAVDLAWTARYRRGEQVTLRPLVAHGRNRDLPAEQDALEALEFPVHLLSSLASPSGTPRDGEVRGDAAVVVLSEVVPWLVARGQVEVDVTVAGGRELPELREAVADPLVSLAVAEAGDGAADGTDWFDLTVEVTVDGEVVPFAELFAALAREQATLVLPSGTWLRLDRPELARLKALIDEARGLVDAVVDDGVRVNRYQAAWFDELQQLGVVARQSDRWAQSVAALRDLDVPASVGPPAGLQAELRPYQQEGLDWLVFLQRNGLGGILADDMGLGKTVQTLALCLHTLAARPDARFLVVAPTSVVQGWRHEADRFAPDLVVRTIHETERRRGTSLAQETQGAHLVVTSYALFRLEFDDYAAERWDLLLLDEAQHVKNHQGKTYRCVRRLDAATKVAITGTPLENSLMDLWALLSIAAPGLYPDPQRFSQVFRGPIERGEAPELLTTLRRRIAPLMRRRTKDAVLAELPPKTEQVVDIELSPRHARLYQTQLQRQRQKVLGLVDDVQRNRFEIFRSLTLLRQLSLDPALVDDAHEGIGSAKIDRLVEDLSQIIAEGHRALVFSQFTRFLGRVRARLDAAGIDHAYLDGRTRKRDEAISSFKDGDVPVFVISLKAGGVGLNLTEADYCFVLDPWWNPAVETQAVDRAHRIGQRNPVMVYRYVAAGTIEEKVMELKARKAALFADVVDADGALAGALSAGDIRGLLDLG